MLATTGVFEDHNTDKCMLGISTAWGLIIAAIVRLDCDDVKKILSQLHGDLGFVQKHMTNADTKILKNLETHAQQKRSSQRGVIPDSSLFSKWT